MVIFLRNIYRLNKTSLIQPMDQGVLKDVFAALKKKYRGNLIREYVEAGQTLKGFWKKPNILDANYYVSESWDDLEKTILQKCWKKLIIPDNPSEVFVVGEPPQESANNPAEPHREQEQP